MLITPEYADLNAKLHDARPDYGTSGRQWAKLVAALSVQVQAESILDYGCGKQTLAAQLPALTVIGYDPAVPGLQATPAPADLVVCTDVLEHVEPDCIDAVMDDLCRVARHAAFVTVATRPAVKTLADGRNAHLTVQGLDWWRERFLERFDIVDVVEVDGHEFALVLRSLHSERLGSTSFRISDFRVQTTPLPAKQMGQGDPGTSPSSAEGRAGEGTIAVVKFEGHRLRFNTPNEMTRWRVETLFTKEPSTIAWLRTMKADDVLVDVGANVGMYTVFAALTRGVKVHAFEPEAQNFALLNSNIALNGLDGQARAYPLALSDRRGVQLLHLSDLRAGGSCHSLGAEVGFDLQPRAAAFSQGSYGMTLDELVATGEIPMPNHLKIDVDGFEHKVLAGAMTVLSDARLRSVLVELNTHLAEHRAVVTQLQGVGLTYEPRQVEQALRKSGAFEGVGEFIFHRVTPKPTGLVRSVEWTLPETSQAREVLSHVVARIAAAKVEEHPFPYAVVDGVFPPDYYRQLLDNFPLAATMKPLSDTGRVLPGAYPERLALLLDSGSLAKLPPAQREFWTELTEWLFHDQFTHACATKFAGALAPRLNRIAEAEGAIRTRGDALLVNDGSRYAIGPHTDSPHRLITFLFYMPEDDRLRDLGTSIYAPKEAGFTCWGGPHHPHAKFDRVATVEFLPNRLLLFPQTERSFHGVEEITRAGVQRRLLIDNVRLLNQTTH